MPQVEVIEVSNCLIEHSPELRLQLAGSQIPCKGGKQFGSRYVGQNSPGLTHDYLPNEMLKNVSNLADFARALVLDKWTSNSDGRQAVFCRKGPRSRQYTTTFIDQGYCFSASEWTFLDYPLRGVYSSNCVYGGVTGWDAFEPALTRAEEMDSESIWRCSADTPEEWYEQDRESLERLVEGLSKRREIIRNLIGDFRSSTRNPFPSWRDCACVAVPCIVTRDEVVEIR